MAEEKHVHRLPPCPDYDIAGVESWLTDLAKEGLLMDQDSQFFGFFSFTRTAPQNVKYRLEPAVKQQSFWDGEPGMPKEEALALYAELGWEYVTRYGDFHIYRSYDPHARELHTDAELLADAVNVIRKRQRSNLVWMVLDILILRFWTVMSYPMGFIISMGLGAMLVFYGFFIIMFLRPLAAVRKLRRIRKQLLAGENIHERVNWKATALRQRVMGHFPDLVFILLIFYILGSKIAEEEQKMELPEITRDPPFVTIADLNPDGEYEPKGLDYANRMRNWVSWPFVDNWEWYEFASIRMDDSTTLSGPLDVKYHEAISPWLAEQLAKELIRYADTGKYFTEAVPLETGFDHVRAYRYQGKYGLDTVLLICDNIVIEAQVLVDNAEGVTARDLWIELMAERLTNQ